jgi:anti-anti-sigma regulatory factor
MERDLRVHTYHLRAATLVAAAGELNRVSATRLRQVLLKCLADQPRAVIVDLSEVVVADLGPLVVLAAVAREASLWPGLPLLVSVPPGPVADALRRAGIDRTVPIRETPAAAIASIADADSVPTIRELLPPLPGAERRARTVTAQTCTRWRLEHLSEPACLIVSELVSNAVRHAGTTMTLRLSRRSRHLLIGVEDGSPVQPPATPLPAGAKPNDPRGLLLVDRIAQRWGSAPMESGGKVVWAVLRLDPAWRWPV